MQLFGQPPETQAWHAFLFHGQFPALITNGSFVCLRRFIDTVLLVFGGKKNSVYRQKGAYHLELLDSSTFLRNNYVLFVYFQSTFPVIFSVSSAPDKTVSGISAPHIPQSASYTPHHKYLPQLLPPECPAEISYTEVPWKVRLLPL